MSCWVPALAMSIALGLTVLIPRVPLEATEPGQTPPPSTPGQVRLPQAPPRDKSGVPAGKAAIRGMVVAADSRRPLRRARLSLTGSALPQPRTVGTDGDGRFEIQDLPAGRYTLNVVRAGYLSVAYGQRFPSEAGQPIEVSAGQQLENIVVALPRAGVISGRVTDELGEAYAGVNLMPMQVRYFQGERRLVAVTGGFGNTTDDSGQYRLLRLPPGEYYVQGTVRDVWETSGERKDMFGYLKTFYPGTANATEAQRVKVGIGQEVHGVDFQMLQARAGRVSGSVIDSIGIPPGGERVTLGQTILGPSLVMSAGLGSAIIDDDGSFEFKAVAPGDYVLSVSSSVESGSEMGAIPISVNGDVNGVVLRTVQPMIVMGSIVDQNGTTPVGVSPERMRLSAVAVDPDRSPIIGSPPAAPVASNWTFELRRLIGRRLFRATNVPDGWALKAVMLDGRDITDEPVDVSPALFKTGRLQVVLTNSVTGLTGTTSNDRGEPVSGATVIAFAEDATKWGDQSRFVQATRPDQSGQFKFVGLPPGAYRVVALEYVEEGDWFDPAFLDRLRGPSTTVKLQADEPQTLALKIVR